LSTPIASATVFWFFSCVVIPAQEAPLPDFDTFAAHVKEHLQTDSERQGGYTYVERRIEQKLDGAGRPKGQTVKVFEVYPGLPGEDNYLRLIEEDGKPVAAATLARRDHDRQKEVEVYAQRQTKLTESDRQKALRAWQKGQKERAEAIDDIFNVYDIRMVGRKRIDGHDTIEFSLAPRPKVKPRTESGEMMHHFAARAWISENEYELVRVEVKALDTLSFGFGLLARVHKGATATYQRRKVNDEVWLPEKVTYAGSGRLLLVRKMNLGGVSEFSNYRKFAVDTATTYSPRPPS